MRIIFDAYHAVFKRQWAFMPTWCVNVIVSMFIVSKLRYNQSRHNWLILLLLSVVLS